MNVFVSNFAQSSVLKCQDIGTKISNIQSSTTNYSIKIKTYQIYYSIKIGLWYNRMQYPAGFHIWLNDLNFSLLFPWLLDNQFQTVASQLGNVWYLLSKISNTYSIFNNNNLPNLLFNQNCFMMQCPVGFHI